MTNSEFTKIPVQVLQTVDAALAHKYRIIPFEFLSENELRIFVDEKQWNANYASELSLVLDYKLVIEPKENGVINALLSRYYQKTQHSNSLKSVGEIGAGIDFLEQKIREAKQISSSDIHFEIYKNDARIRYRIDGKLVEKYRIKKPDYLELVNKVKIKADLNITEKRLPQDGRITIDETNIRVSVLPTLYGEKMVLRLLGTDTTHLSIQKIGMNTHENEAYLNALKSSKGIILISGPTGSGKTTTLYASLKHLNATHSNILTVEDPVEYTLEGINQVQLKEDIGLTFASVLRSFLRQDPDVIMLGEIRDQQTAEMAIRASLTGHLVLSTIHTNSAVGTISRLVDMGVPAFLIAETLKVSVAQRLVRKLCNNCKKQIGFDNAEYKNESLNNLPTHYVPVGCNSCYFTGYQGRQAIYELVSNDNSLRYQIKNNAQNLQEDEVLKSSERLKSKAIALVKEGVTSIEEVYSIISEL